MRVSGLGAAIRAGRDGAVFSFFSAKNAKSVPPFFRPRRRARAVRRRPVGWREAALIRANIFVTMRTFANLDRTRWQIASRELKVALESSLGLNTWVAAKSALEDTPCGQKALQLGCKRKNK